MPRSPLTLANFHLDAGGENEHRTAQLAALASSLGSGGPQRRRLRRVEVAASCGAPLVACGDTNAFSFDAAAAEAALARMVAPLRRAHGAVDAHADAAEPAATHFFARAHEPKIGHRIAVAVGRLGVDFPRRYDVIVSALRRVGAAGVTTTEGSDHDLVWAGYAYPRRK